MGLLVETLRRSFARRANVPLPARDGWSQRYVLPRERDYVNDVGDGAGSSLVVAGIDFIANGFIEAPIQVSERNGDDIQVVPDHPMTELLRRPNPFYSGALLWMPTIASWIVDGNAYWLIEFSAGERPARLWWLPPWSIEPKAPNDGSEFLSHYEYKPGGNASTYKLDPQQVVHFRWGLDSRNPRKGHSRLKSVLREIYTDEEAARFTSALLHNLGVVGIVISPKGEISVPYAEAQAHKIELMQKTTGEHRGEPLVMTTATEVDQYGFSPEQMDLSAMRAIPESRVPACLGLSAAVLNFLSGMQQTTVGATMAEIREQGYETGTIPKMRLMAEDLHSQLLGHYTDTPERFKVEFDLSDVRVLQEDANKLHERLRDDVKAGVRTVASFKLAVGEVPEPGDDIYLRPFNVTEVGPDAQPVVPPANVTPIRGQIAASRALLRKATKEQLSYLRQVERSGQKLTPRFASDVQKAFDELAQQAAAAWEALPQRFVADPKDDPIVASIIEALALEQWRSSRLTPLWRTHYLRTAELVYDALKANLAIDIGTNLPDPVGVQVVAAGGRNLGLVDLDASTRRALFEALAEARTEGLGPVEAARRIRRYVGAGRFTAMEAEKAGSGVRYRAELIARTETLNAQRVAVAEAGRAAGYTQYLAFDNRTGFGDEECVARDGAEFTYDEMLAANAEEHPNGTLGWAPVPASQIAASAERGDVREEVVHVEYGDDGRVARVLKEVRHG